jgi:hypothetical protein
VRKKILLVRNSAAVVWFSENRALMTSHPSKIEPLLPEPRQRRGLLAERGRNPDVAIGNYVIHHSTPIFSETDNETLRFGMF